MKFRSIKQAKSESWKSLLANRKVRFALILLSLAAVSSIAVSLLVFAQKQEKEVRSETKAERADKIERPERAAPNRKESTAGKKRGRNSIQDQQLAAASQEQAGEKDRGERKPREFRMRRARPFTGDLRQLPQGSMALMERPELEGPEP